MTLRILREVILLRDNGCGMVNTWRQYSLYLHSAQNTVLWRRHSFCKRSVRGPAQKNWHRHEWRSRLPKPELGRGAGDGNGDVKGGGDASGEARALCRNRDRPKEFSAKTGYNLHRIEGCDHDRRPSLGGRHHNLSNCDFDKEDSRGGGRSANLNKNNSVSEFPQTMRFSADNMDSVGRTCELPSPSPACDSKASGTSSKSYFSRVDRRNCASRPPPFSVIGDRDKLYNSNGSDEKSEGDCDGDKHLPDSRCSVKRDQYELATASVQPRTSRRGGGVACRRGYTIDDSTHTPATVLGSAVPESSGMKFDLDVSRVLHVCPRWFSRYCDGSLIGGILTALQLYVFLDAIVCGA